MHIWARTSVNNKKNISINTPKKIMHTQSYAINTSEKNQYNFRYLIFIAYSQII